MSEETPATAPATEPTPSKGMPKWVIVLIVVVVLLLIGGSIIQKFVFKKIAEVAIEKTIESKTGAKVDISGDQASFKIQGEDGQMEFGTANKWPADMPGIVPEVRAGSIQAAMSNTDDEGAKTWSVVIKDVEQIQVESYVADLQSKGWKMGTQANMGIAIYQLSKDNYELSLGADPSSKGLTIGLREVKSEALPQ